MVASKPSEVQQGSGMAASLRLSTAWCARVLNRHDILQEADQKTLALWSPAWHQYGAAHATS